MMLRLLLALALSAAAQTNPLDTVVEGVDGGAQAARDENPELTRIVAERIKNDAAVRASLAERISVTKFARNLGTREELEKWANENPDSAAFMAIGLAKDDASGTKDFEDQIHESTRQKLEYNENSKKNVFGRLSKAAKNSRLMNKDADMQDEERSEILKNIFEGKTNSSSKILNVKDNPGGKAPGAAVGNIPANYFDRLGQGNLRGYSPQLQSMQSALNQRRVPGAPKLIETGRLDYETLSYPGHGMRYDIAGIERRLRLDRNWNLSKLLGREAGLTEQKLLDPAFESELARQAAAAGKSLSPRFDRRQAALERAAAALRDFQAAAEAARNPDAISKALLVSLGGKQREAARWITVAALEEELERLDNDEAFLSPELLAMIQRCPVEEGDKASYKRRGEQYLVTLKRVKADAEQAVARLTSDEWLAHLSAVDKSLAESSAARRSIARNISDYRAVPYHLLALDAPKPRWRELLDQYAKRLAPSLAYSRRLLSVDASRAKLKDVFHKIAAGDIEAAHTILAAYQPQGAPPSKR